MNSAFPTLLNKRAKILAGLNRTDLAFLGGGYLLLSFFKVSGITGLIFNAIVLLIVKLVTNKLPRGFFREINAPEELKWSYTWEE